MTSPLQSPNPIETIQLNDLGDVHPNPEVMGEVDEHGSTVLNGNGDPRESRQERQGTIGSARFNVLATMVGGGSLSLPFAFHKSGNSFLGPMFLILVAASAEFCFRLLIASDRLVSQGHGHQPDWSKKGNGSFEAVASAAFGPKALIFSMCLVWAMCFFGTVGYAVLLRDMLEPISDFLVSPVPGSGSPTLPHNLVMLTVVLLVTPLCTLQTLTALQRFGATSMISVLILGTCVLYRSLQCNLAVDHTSDRHVAWFDYITSFPHSIKDVLDALPLFISTFVCHYQILPVQNELQSPTPERVAWWIRSTTWSAACFYLVIGFSGSMYGNCTPSGSVQGNVLLDFNEDDSLLLMGRLCLALTIALAFPMLVIPARDVVLRSLKRHTHDGIDSEDLSVHDNDLVEPLLESDESTESNSLRSGQIAVGPESFTSRLVTATLIFWSGAAVACFVTSIDIVWDLLGSSLSILLSYIIPCGSYIVLQRNADAMSNQEDGTADVSNAEFKWEKKLKLGAAWFLLLLFTPIMFISTGNAIYNTFWDGADD